MKASIFGFLVLCIACANSPFARQVSKPEQKVTRGWLSDEGCAKERASSGKFTGTTPECAKRCVAEGKKIVLIDPDQKRVLEITNQDAAKNNIGDYVEVTGDINSQTKVLHIDTLKMLEPGRAMCEAPRRKKS